MAEVITTLFPGSFLFSRLGDAGNEVVVMDDRGSLHILQLIEWRLIEDDRV